LNDDAVTSKAGYVNPGIVIVSRDVDVCEGLGCELDHTPEVETGLVPDHSTHNEAKHVGAVLLALRGVSVELPLDVGSGFLD